MGIMGMELSIVILVLLLVYVAPVAAVILCIVKGAAKLNQLCQEQEAIQNRLYAIEQALNNGNLKK